MIRRITDPGELLTLAVACALPGHFDDGAEYLDRANVFGWGSPLRGAFLFEPITGTSAQAHVMVHPLHRGKEAIEAGKECLAHMLALGISVVGVTPKDRRDAIAYARAVGLQIAGETHDDVYTFGGGG